MSRERVLLVEGGWQRGVLAGARSLGLAGHHVTVASAARGHAARSRHVAAWLPLPPATSPGLVAAVAAAVRRSGSDVVLPGDDEHLLLLSASRDVLGARLPSPPHDTVLRALDKLRLSEAARAAGLPVPDASEQRPADPAGWLLKHRLYGGGRQHDVVEADAGPAVPGAFYQRRITGRLLAVVVLVAPDGRVLHLAAQAARALHPEPFGVSARADVVPVPAGLEPQVRALLDELGWTGLAELQFVVDARGVPWLIDFNGRLFGSLALSLHAGADLPQAWVAAACGRPVELGPARLGARYQWLEGDLRRAASSSRPLVEAAAALRWAPGAAHSLWAAHDPVPGALLSRDLLLRALQRGRAS